MRRTVSACVAAALAASSLVLIVSPAEAKTPRCFGKKATIVGTNGDDNDFDGSGSGHPVIRGTKKADVIVARGGDDVILAGGGNDLICGNGGDDLIAPMGGSDKVDGGPGSNQLFYGFAKRGVNVNLPAQQATGEGADLIKRFDTVSGSDFNDSITGDSNTNFLFGGSGDDQLIGGPTSTAGDEDQLDIIAPGDGDDSVDGGDGFDMVSYQDFEPPQDSTSTTGVNIDLFAGRATGFGTDRLSHLEAVWGSEFDDTIKGDNASNFLVPAGGNDAVSGGSGFDYAIFWFASGDVTANLATGTATGEGNDTIATDVEGLFGSIAGNDTLTGDNKNNFIGGDEGNDVIDGGGGDDWLAGGGGNDSITGGDGNYDLADFSTALGNVTANLATGNATGEGTDTMSGVEALFGSQYDDVLTGDANVNYLFGWAGNDQLNAGAGNDEMDGGDNVDSASGQGGNDKCANSETTLDCTIVQANQIKQHPLVIPAQQVAAFRRNF